MQPYGINWMEDPMAKTTPLEFSEQHEVGNSKEEFSMVAKQDKPCLPCSAIFNPHERFLTKSSNVPLMLFIAASVQNRLATPT